MFDRMAPSGASAPAERRPSLAGRLLPPLALMAVIFVVSAQPDLNSGLGVVDLVGRKLLHAIEYGALWWLWHRAFGFRRPWLAAAIALAYAGADEYHQTFVHGRHGTPVDVGVDAAGIAVAWGLDRRWRPGRRSEPAALGGEQDGLGPVDRAQLPIDVVQVAADRARREG
jgi:VanZ family protein